MNKKAKNLIIFVGIIILLAIVYAAVLHINKSAQEALDTSIQLYENTEDKITGVTLSKAEDTEPYLDIKKENDVWISPDSPEIELDTDKVNTMLSTFIHFSADKLVASGAGDLTEYGLDAPVLTVKLTDETGERTFYFGAKNQVTSQYYVCEEGKNDVYAVSLNTYSTIYAKSADSLVKETETESETDTVQTES